VGFFLSLVALAIAFGGGIGALLLLSPSALQKSYFGFLGTALVVGAGIISLLSFVLGFFIQGVLLRSTLTGICIVLLVVGLLRCPKEFWKRQRPWFGWTQVLLVVLIVGQVWAVTWLSLYKSDLGWDGLFVWEGKAHIAFRHNGALPLHLFNGGYPITVTEYPVFLPMLQVWIYDWLGHIDQSMIKLIGPYLYLAAMFMLVSAAQRTSKKPLLTIVPLLLLPVVPQFVLGYGSVASGYADFPLGVVWLCTVVHAMEFSTTGSLDAARLTGASAMFLPFVKNDGFIALLCITLTVVPTLLKKRDRTAALWILAPAFTIWLGWRIFLHLCHIKPAYLLPLTWSTLVTHLNRTGTIARFTAQELTAWDRWGILWPAALASAVFLVSRRATMKWYPLVVNALLPLVLYPCVFFFSAYGSVQVHLSVALSRLFIHNGLSAVLLIATATMILFQQERKRTSEPASSAERSYFDSALQSDP
jgi:hypothetical protein